MINYEKAQKSDRFLRITAVNAPVVAAVYTTARLMIDTALDLEMPRIIYPKFIVTEETEK